MKTARLLGRLSAIAESLEIETKFLVGEDEEAHARLARLVELLKATAAELDEAGEPAPAVHGSYLEPAKLAATLERALLEHPLSPCHSIVKGAWSDVVDAREVAKIWVPLAK